MIEDKIDTLNQNIERLIAVLEQQGGGAPEASQGTQTPPPAEKTGGKSGGKTPSRGGKKGGKKQESQTQETPAPSVSKKEISDEIINMCNEFGKDYALQVLGNFNVKSVKSLTEEQFDPVYKAVTEKLQELRSQGGAGDDDDPLDDEGDEGEEEEEGEDDWGF